MIPHLIDKIIQHSSSVGSKKIIFPEGSNLLIQKVAKRLVEEKLAICFLVFKNRKEVPKESMGVGLNVLVIDEFDLDSLATTLLQLRKNKIDWKKSRLLVTQPNYFAMMLLKLGKADCFLGGIDYLTTDILRPAFQIIKLQSHLSAATSAVLMVKDQHYFLFADCALTIAPNPSDLVNITKNTVLLADKLGFIEKKVAMLSFSTAGSGGNHPLVTLVQEATTQAKNELGDQASIVGDIQFDAAFSQLIRKKKWPSTKPHFAGSANIFIFPDLNSGNIGYKIAQQLGQFEAIGPLVIGLNAPVNDLSRGATVSDIYQTAIVTLSQVEEH